MSPSARRYRGFTLVELLAAMVIGSLILLAAASLLASSGDGYARVGGGVATEREARALISQLGSDLSTAIHHEDWVHDSSGGSWPADRIGFLSLQPALAQSDGGRIGDLCAVHYYIKDLNIGGKTVRCLMRGFRESSDTFNALGNGNVGALFQPDDDLDEPVAFGVVGFEARPMSRNDDGSWTDWVRGGEKKPEAFDVRLVVARRDLIARLQTPADWDGGGNSGRQIGNHAQARDNRHLEVYGAMIRFGNHESF